MQPKPGIQSPKYLKEGAVILLILFVVLSLFTPRFIEYSDYRVVRAIPIIINFSGIPLLVILLLVLQNGIFKPYFIIYGILALFIAAIASNMINYEAKANALKTNGVWGKAIVTEKKQVKTRGGKRWQIKCSFMANNQRFETLYESDNKNTYKKGDTLDIQYNKDFPKMYELKRVH
ncbi:MAG: hypothetical protein V4553_20045 [Bacteroidota bacterium]